MDDSLGGMKTRDGGVDGPAAYGLAAGDTLGQFRILRPLGRGGMGEVYLAEHAQLGTRIALKIIRPEFAADPGFVDRFRREARLMARLKHPNIVPCRDAGLDRGMPWLAMDYIESPRGQPMDLFELLAERRESGKLFDEDEAIAVGLQICDALAYAHSYRDDEVPAGILHRDLKPGNILVGPDTRLYVADFGLARIMGKGFEKSVIEQSLSGLRSLGDRNTMGAAKVATSSDRVGTFDYMSPEQREGKEADARSDVFALGAILYELLTGRKVAGVPMRPSKARPGLNPVWDGIVYERCLTADPAERYGSAAELKAAILAATASKPAAPPRASREEDGHKDAKILKGRGPAWIVYAAVAALLVIMLLGVIRALRYEPGRQPEAERVADLEPPPPRVVPPLSAPAVPAGSIRVLATVPPEAEMHFQGLGKRIRIGSNPWTVASTLPFVVTGIPSGSIDVEIEAIGYEATGGPRSVAAVGDATSDVAFALSPRPARLTVSCNAPDATVQVGTGGPPVRLSGSAVEVPAFVPVSLTVSAPDHTQQTVNLGAMNPAQGYTKSVTLEKQRFPDLRSPWENSLGLKFVPVPGTEALFCVWETRNMDYRMFVPDHNSGSAPGMSLNSDYQPVVNVSCEDAEAFCAWLTQRERGLGLISSDQSYRLPADWEWSVAVGLRETKGGSPKDKDAKTPDVFPWGNQWPPPRGAGNYDDRTAKRALSNLNVTDGYDDGFVVTAPAGSFGANYFGLYDMGGNVWEWCEDWYDMSRAHRVLRGGSWRFYGRESLLSSNRDYGLPGNRNDYYGFRVILSSSSPQIKTMQNAVRAASAVATPKPTAGTGPAGGQDWTSPATGMEFVWIPALKIWVGKYEVTNGEYRKKIPHHDSKDYQGNSLNGDRQPVVYVNFDDAKAFAEWMTQRDRSSGELPADCRYRLPSEQEWQAFAQCGDNRNYPWGSAMPPKNGNYCGQETKGIAGSMIDGFDDGSVVTCDVTKSGKNDWGLYGVGGNVWEAAASDSSGGSFGAWRGASWGLSAPVGLRCGLRVDGGASDRDDDLGFRLVLAR